jgi:predicted adenine nucleotide alpha hydrolase (AANH) superfamily ATPase
MKVVLHICCAVCAAGAAGSLLAEGHQVLGFYYNPNIYPVEEYQRRLDAVRRVADELDFLLKEGSYAPEGWLLEVDYLKEEPEGGKRCEVCFRYRLVETHRFLCEQGWDTFTTTLTVGPRKSAAAINRIGYDIGGDTFLARDFKKRDGFRKATEMAKTWGLYRQSYCGCLFSLKEREHRHKPE